MHLGEPADVARGFMEAWNDRDPDAVAELFTHDADFINVVGLWWEDVEAIRRAHARGFRVMFGLSHNVLEHTKVRMLGSHAAVVHARWRMTGQVGPDGAPVGGRSGVITFVVQNFPQTGWRAVAAHNTDRIKGAETLVAGDGALTPMSYFPPRRVPGTSRPAGRSRPHDDD